MDLPLLVTTVIVQAAHPQLCYSNLSKGAVKKKSNVCKQISEVAQKTLGVDISGEKLIDVIPSIGVAPTQTPFSFAPKETSAKSKTSATKASTVLENVKPSTTKTETKTQTVKKPQHNHPTWRSGYCYLNKGECDLNQSKDGSFVKWVAKNNN